MRKGLRLFAWYRVVPVALMLAVGAVSFVYSYAPAPLFGLLYPLDYEDYITDSSERHTVDPFLRRCGDRDGVELERTSGFL